MPQSSQPVKELMTSLISGNHVLRIGVGGGRVRSTVVSIRQISDHFHADHLVVAYSESARKQLSTWVSFRSWSSNSNH
jgi:hypothetical protein